MSKTGFSNGFADVPTSKYYKYHGLVRSCNTEPVLPPYLEFPNKPPYGPEKTICFETSMYDGLNHWTWNYSETRNAAEGYHPWPEIYQRTEFIQEGYTLYDVARLFVGWDTINLKYDCEIVSAYIKLHCTYSSLDERFNVIVMNGQPTYPHIPLEFGDFQLSKYSGIGGKQLSGPEGSFIINLNDLGISWINKEGYTKFAILNENDFLGIQALFLEVMGFSWTAHTPELHIVYKDVIHEFDILFAKNDVIAIGSTPTQTIYEGLKAHLNKSGYSRLGWVFAGWATSPAGGVSYLDKEFYTMGTENVILYAKYNPNLYSINFDKDDPVAYGAMVEQNIYSSYSANIRINAFAKLGWYFSGWAITSGGPKVFSDREYIKMGTENVILYAKWLAHVYSIYFDKNDEAATGYMNSLSFECGSGENLRNITYYKEGWTFVGWSEDPAGPVVYVNQEWVIMGYENKTIYAKWVANIYNITFDKNDILAGGSMSEEEIASGSNKKLTICGFTKAGWIFSGWALLPGGIKEYEDEENYIMGTENVVLYAIWIEE